MCFFSLDKKPDQTPFGAAFLQRLNHSQNQINLIELRHSHDKKKTHIHTEYMNAIASALTFQHYHIAN